MRRTLTQSKYAVYSLLSLLFVTIHRISEFISLLTHVLYVYNAHITWRKENDIMAKYVYPAIFTPEEDGSILSIFLISTDAIPVETTLRTE